LFVSGQSALTAPMLGEDATPLVQAIRLDPAG
jgi:hypothetical protein